MFGKKIIIAIFIIVSLISTVAGQSGGSIILEQTVISGGNSNSIGGNFKLEGTIGQSSAGIKGINQNMILYTGFWTPEPFVPTAANAAVSGRVVSRNGKGIKGAKVILSGGMLNAPLIKTTNSSGEFRFEDVEVGQFYILTVQHKKYGFPQNMLTFTLIEDLEGIIFEAG